MATFFFFFFFFLCSLVFLQFDWLKLFVHISINKNIPAEKVRVGFFFFFFFSFYILQCNEKNNQSTLKQCSNDVSPADHWALLKPPSYHLSS